MRRSYWFIERKSIWWYINALGLKVVNTWKRKMRSVDLIRKGNTILMPFVVLSMEQNFFLHFSLGKNRAAYTRFHFFLISSVTRQLSFQAVTGPWDWQKGSKWIASYQFLSVRFAVLWTLKEINFLQKFPIYLDVQSKTRVVGFWQSNIFGEHHRLGNIFRGKHTINF